MSRTTEELVASILEVDETIDLAPFIEIANELVTEVCASATNSDGTAYYTNTRLEMIERYLAAHFYAVRDPRATSESAGGISASFEGSAGMGLDFTRYGQQVKLLDTAGGLAMLDKKTKDGTIKKKVGVHHLGAGQRARDEFRRAWEVE